MTARPCCEREHQGEGSSIQYQEQSLQSPNCNALESFNLSTITLCRQSCTHFTEGGLEVKKEQLVPKPRVETKLEGCDSLKQILPIWISLQKFKSDVFWDFREKNWGFFLLSHGFKIHYCFIFQTYFSCLKNKTWEFFLIKNSNWIMNFFHDNPVCYQWCSIPFSNIQISHVRPPAHPSTPPSYPSSIHLSTPCPILYSIYSSSLPPTSSSRFPSISN